MEWRQQLDPFISPPLGRFTPSFHWIEGSVERQRGSRAGEASGWQSQQGFRLSYPTWEAPGYKEANRLSQYLDHETARPCPLPEEPSTYRTLLHCSVPSGSPRQATQGPCQQAHSYEHLQSCIWPSNTGTSSHNATTQRAAGSGVTSSYYC